MPRRRIAKTLILSVLPPAVLCLLYGLWLLLDAPGSAAAVMYALVLLLLFIAVYVFSVWDTADRIRKTDKLTEPPLVRERNIDAREMMRITFVLLCIRLITFLLAYIWELLVNGYSGTIFEIQHIWADHPLAVRYISMANRGYSWETGGAGVHANLLVAPLYGLIIRFLSPSASSSIKVAFVLANLNTVLAGTALYALATQETDRRHARFAVTFFCLLPSSCLMSCTIADSTFLLLSVLACYAARKRIFFAAAGFSALSALAAPQGIALLIPVAIEYDIYLREKLHSDREERSLPLWIGEGVSLLIIPAGLLLYLYKNRTITGDPFYFVKLSGGYRWFFDQGASVVRALLTADRRTLFCELLPAVTALPASLVLILLARKQLPAGSGVYFAFYLVCIPNAGNAWPRLLYTCFPVILAAAELASRKKWGGWVMIIVTGALVLLRLGMYTLGWGAA